MDEHNGSALEHQDHDPNVTPAPVEAEGEEHTHLHEEGGPTGSG